MAENSTITLSKDHVYGIVIVALVALLTISVFTSGFGIMPLKTNGTGGSCNPATGVACNGTGATGTNGSTVTTDPYAGMTQLQLTVGNLPMKGQASAPVTWVEFSDFQCPFCSKLYLQTDKQVQTGYVDTGKVKMYFRNCPLSFHDKAHIAAEATICANEQGKFWEMHDKLFTDQNKWTAASNTTSALSDYASGLGLDATKFASCLATGKYADEVDADASEAESFGVRGTPGVFLMLPKAKTDVAALKNVVTAYGEGIKLYQNSDSVIVFVGGAYPYSAFSQILNTVTY